MSVVRNNSRKVGLVRSRTLSILGSILLVGLVVESAVFAFTYFNAGIPNPSTKPSAVQATPVLKPSATIQSKVVTKSDSSFRFTAAGDYGQTSYTTANLNYIAHSGVNFHLGLGDFDYDPNTTAEAWS